MATQTGDLKFQLVQAAIQGVAATQNATNVASTKINDGEIVEASAAAAVARQIAEVTKDLGATLTDLESRFPDPPA